MKESDKGKLKGVGDKEVEEWRKTKENCRKEDHFSPSVNVGENSEG